MPTRRHQLNTNALFQPVKFFRVCAPLHAVVNTNKGATHTHTHRVIARHDRGSGWTHQSRPIISWFVTNHILPLYSSVEPCWSSGLRFEAAEVCPLCTACPPATSPLEPPPHTPRARARNHGSESTSTTSITRDRWTYKRTQKPAKIQ